VQYKLPGMHAGSIVSDFTVLAFLMFCACVVAFVCGGAIECSNSCCQGCMLAAL